jgi:6-phosphogluconolactonase/glucosamine-6-phosphate isomerase/deaminase
MLTPCYQVAFPITGAGKAGVLAAVLDPSVPAQQALPSARVRQAGGAPPTWIVDAAAAAKLPAELRGH